MADTPLSPSNQYIKVVPVPALSKEANLWKLQPRFLNHFQYGFKALHVVKYK